MHEKISAILTADKAVAFAFIEPLYCSLFHVFVLLFLFRSYAGGTRRRICAGYWARTAHDRFGLVHTRIIRAKHTINKPKVIRVVGSCPVIARFQRELAMQVQAQYDHLRYGRLPRTALVIGGMAERPQLEAVRKGAGIIVATPGRLEDYLKRKLIDLRHVELLVLDEADRMLDMGFLPALRRIVAALPRERQTLCFSATLEASVAGLVNDYMRNPVRVALGSTTKPAESVELQAFEVTAAGKAEALRHLLYQEKGQTLVFARTKRGTERLAKNLVRDGFSAAMIHGDRTQSQRVQALTGFDEGRYKVLVATDVASRGIHVDNVAHVINYDLPEVAEDFIHRVGRTGRAGAKGRASSLVSGAEIAELRTIERALKLKIARRRVDEFATAAASHRPVQNTLLSRTLSRMPGEVFC